MEEPSAACLSAPYTGRGKIEYDYLGLRSWSWSPGLFRDTFTVSRNTQMLKAGINYRFDWGSPFGREILIRARGENSRGARLGMGRGQSTDLH